MSDKDRLFQAIMDGNVPAVATLLEQHADLINAQTPSGVPAVLFSLYFGQPGLVRLFLERGAAVDICTAAALGILSRMRLLLTHNPGLANAEAKDGFSPLGLASFFGRADAIHLLLDYGAQVNRPSNNPQKVMPLHSAAAGQHMQIVRYLVEAGAQVNALQAGDFSPLMSAAQNGQLEMVDYLLEHGADPCLKSVDGRDALELAREQGHTSVVARLEEVLAVKAEQAVVPNEDAAQQPGADVKDVEGESQP